MERADFLSGLSAASLWVKEKLSFAPDWMVDPALIAAALLVALILYSLVVAILRRLVSPRRVGAGLTEVGSRRTLRSGRPAAGRWPPAASR